MQLRVRDDAGAAAGQRGGDPLEHIHLPALPPQQQGREQPAHGPAGDNGAHPTLPLSGRSWALGRGPGQAHHAR